MFRISVQKRLALRARTSSDETQRGDSAQWKLAISLSLSFCQEAEDFAKKLPSHGSHRHYSDRLRDEMRSTWGNGRDEAMSFDQARGQSYDA